MLSPRQRRLLKTLRSFWARHGYAPSLRELKDLTRIPSISTVRTNIKKLEKVDLVTMQEGIARSIRPTIKGWAYPYNP